MNIHSACTRKGMLPVCNHANYNDGQCEPFGNFHISYPHHTRAHAREIKPQSLENAYTYCGRANGRKSLQYVGNSHRWSNSNDKDGQTLCTRPLVATGTQFRYKNSYFRRVRVAGNINSNSIIQACRRAGMIPVCDHSSYSDGHCKNFHNRWHFSHPSHIPVSYTHLRAHETVLDLVCRLLLEKKKYKKQYSTLKSHDRTHTH
eukprot:TRINITY_DN9247_c0_g1_i1.p1 TRINITY_DN9247_c0_g1~~TRINITY_DN9247_c0_g1_i1.p1  ORF type:complete len:203 (-),score=19.80 TRINITY_DN9247_c0_g1_i1:6-614(-)